ncbi:hypothetical protein F9Z35_0664 [Neisseria gonorrhoeae]|nr:hypothetical protein F9Z35_0664 [Neisseria gonorrhoeae]
MSGLSDIDEIYTLIDNSIFTIHFQPIEFQYLKIHRISDAAKQAFKKAFFPFGIYADL